MAKVDSKKEILNNIDIKEFANEIVQKLAEENIPATPENYKIYFDKLIDEKSPDFKQKVSENLLLDDDSDERASMEADIKQAFSQIKGMLQTIALVYKNLGILRTIISKRLNELKTNTSSLGVKNVLNAFDGDLLKLNTLLDKHISIIKDTYEGIGKVFKSLEEQIVYDTKFGVFNKKYFLKNINTELDSVARYNYNSSIVIVRLSKDVVSKINNLKEKDAVLKNISRLLLKTSRRSDIVAYYGEECFGIIMKHTNIESASKACERIYQMLSATTFFIGENELSVKTDIAVSDIAKDKSTEELISNILDAIEKPIDDDKIYHLV